MEIGFRSLYFFSESCFHFQIRLNVGTTGFNKINLYCFLYSYKFCFTLACLWMMVDILGISCLAYGHPFKLFVK